MLTIQDVERFYAAKEIHAGCPTCGHRGWVIAEPPDHVSQWALTSVRQDGNIALPSPVVPALVLYCSNCYGLRLHAQVAVAQWLKDNPEATTT